MTRQRPPSQGQPDTTVEGLTGRLPFLAGGLIFFLALLILLRIRSATVAKDAVLDFDTIGLNGLGAIMAVILLAPLVHTLSHALALRLAGSPLRVQRRLIYPRVRPIGPLSRQTATRVLLAPLGLSLLLFVLMFVRPIGVPVAIWNAVNLALSTNDIWKVLGLRRFPATAAFDMHANHCSLVEKING